MQNPLLFLHETFVEFDTECDTKVESYHAEFDSYINSDVEFHPKVNVDKVTRLSYRSLFQIPTAMSCRKIYIF